MPDQLDIYKAALGRAAREMAATEECPPGWGYKHPDCAVMHPDETPGTDNELCENCWWDYWLAYGEIRVARMNPDQPPTSERE